MRSALVAAALVLGVVSPALADGNDVPKKHLKSFGDLIRHYGYNCGKAEFGQLAGVDHYGKSYRIRCTGYVAFRVTIRPNKQAPIVRPW